VFVVIGVGAGVVCAAAVALLLRSFIFGISPFDPLTFVGVPVVLGVVALVASYIPARRATLIDPMDAIRAD
jgi:ABC-type lipoprotein release transport system permease subunit